jgi:hypothetical protein
MKMVETEYQRMMRERMTGADVENEELSSVMGGFGIKNDFSKPALVMEAMRDVRRKLSEEMKYGYFNEMEINGNIFRTYMPDTRKQAIMAIKALMALVAPEVKKDTEFLEKLKQMNIEEKKFYDHFKYKEVREGEDLKPVYTGFEYMPQIDEMVTIYVEGEFNDVEGGWNRHVNAYYDCVLPLYLDLFAEINMLIHRSGYFKRKYNVK